MCSSLGPASLGLSELPGLPAGEYGTAWSTSCHLAHLVHQPPPCHTSSMPQLLISAPPASLDECFFFNSLIVRFPYSSIFWQFWLFSFLNWLPFFWLRRKQSVSTYITKPINYNLKIKNFNSWVAPIIFCFLQLRIFSPKRLIVSVFYSQPPVTLELSREL